LGYQKWKTDLKSVEN